MFLLPASLAPCGAASLVGWGIILGGALLPALTFAWLTARWPQTGGPYAYARNCFKACMRWSHRRRIVAVSDVLVAAGLPLHVWWRRNTPTSAAQ